MVVERSKWLKWFTPILKLADPGLNPVWGYNIDRPELKIIFRANAYNIWRVIHLTESR